MNIALMMFGLLFALVMVALFLIVFPQFRPGYIQYTVRMGDIFFNHPEWVRPPKNPDEVIATYPISWDDEGFRIPAWQADTYSVIAIGDSFTEAANVAKPWPDVLAEALNIPVKNLGFRGFGPTEEAYVLSQLDADEIPETLVIGYFEGNDLSNVITSQNELALPSEQDTHEIIATDFDNVDFTDFRYPMQVDLGNETLQDIAFFEWYVWGLNTTQDALRNSRNSELLKRDYSEIRQVLPDTCIVAVYFPSKPHIYTQYLTPESQELLMRNQYQNVLDEDQQLLTTRVDDPEITFDDVTANFGNQRDVVRDIISDVGMEFFDVTPILMDAASSGELVYYVYDTHWNQQGHNLVGTAIADYLQSNPCTD